MIFSRINIQKFVFLIILLAFYSISQASTPLWTIDALTPNVLSINRAGLVAYRVTNQSHKTHSLKVKSVRGITQLTLPAVACNNLFTLQPSQSCILVLLIEGQTLLNSYGPLYSGGPVVCDNGNPLQCYQPKAADTLNITIADTRNTTAHTVGGNISGLVGSVTLINNGTDVLTRSTDGNFTFATPLSPGTPYSVTIGTQPVGQICTVNNRSGIMRNTDVTNVIVTCANNAYTVGGNVSGLNGTVVLNNDGENLAINANGSFTFLIPVAQGANYNVIVTSQPTGQICTVSNGYGTMGGANVTNVGVVCSTNSYSIGGNVSGLSSGAITLLNNGTDPLIVNSNGSFTFSALVAQGSPYQVTIASQPPNQSCTVFNSTGVMGGANVTNVIVNCSPAAQGCLDGVSPTYVIPVTPGRTLSGTVTLVNNCSGTVTNASIILPSGWTDVIQDATDCAVLTNGSTCNVTFTSTIPYIAQDEIALTGDNVRFSSRIALAFSINGYLVFSVDTSSSATVIDNVSQPSSQWMNSNIQTAAQSNTDGFTNTSIIVNTPNFTTGPAINCYNSTAGGAAVGTWYLPAICQLGFSTATPSPSCPTGIANIEENLFNEGFLSDLLFTSSGFNAYWSSTQTPFLSFPIGTPGFVWTQVFNLNGGYQTLFTGYDDILPITFPSRCVRSISY